MASKLYRYPSPSKTASCTALETCFNMLVQHVWLLQMQLFCSAAQGLETGGSHAYLNSAYIRCSKFGHMQTWDVMLVQFCSVHAASCLWLYV